MLSVALSSARATVSSPAGVHTALEHEGCDQCKQKRSAAKANQLIFRVFPAGNNSSTSFNWAVGCWSCSVDFVLWPNVTALNMYVPC